MKVCILIKQVPDTYDPRGFSGDDLLADRGGNVVIDEIDERSVELGLSLRNADQVDTISVLSMGPKSTEKALRRALAMGADEARLISDACLAGADLQLTSRVLAAAIEAESADLVIMGDRSTDGQAGMLGGLLAGRLKYHLIPGLIHLEVAGEHVTAQIDNGEAVQVVRSPLPAVAISSAQLPEARTPGLRGIMKAKRKPLITSTPSEVGVQSMNRLTKRIQADKNGHQRAGIIVEESDQAIDQLFAFLQEKGLGAN